MKKRNTAIDLTDLAVGIMVLGLVVSIGANIMINIRDNRLTDLTTLTTSDETIAATDATAGTNLANSWLNGVTTVNNATGSGETLTAANYTVTTDPISGIGNLVFNALSAYNGTDVNVTYNYYDTL